MANIKLKDINKLETWDKKELRKLKITVNNRLSAMEASSNPKELPESHPLFEMDQDRCKDLLAKIYKAEKTK